MKDISKLLISIFGCEVVGLLGTPFTLVAIPTWYQTLNKPFFAPPNWLFGPVWTVLYALMGISFYLIWKQGWKKKKQQQVRLFFLLQLFCNFFWTPVFFGLRSPELGLIVILTLLILIVATIQKMYAVSKPAAYLLIPYLIWVSFASILNGAIALLN